MAILSLGFVGLSLLPHSAGGAIVAMGGSYLPGTYISTSVVSAFTTASSALSQIGAVAAGVATNPITLAGATVAVVAAGAYCYFHGIPAPIADTLASAGIGAATKKGFAVSLPKLAVALVVLGGAGYLSYRFYKNLMALRLAKIGSGSTADHTRQAAEARVAGVFGRATWAMLGEAAWSTAAEMRTKAVEVAQHAVEVASKVSDAAVATGRATASAAVDVATAASDATSTAAGAGRNLVGKFIGIIRARFAGYGGASGAA